jgi:peptidoglycan-associated lipoprotein
MADRKRVLAVVVGLLAVVLLVPACHKKKIAAPPPPAPPPKPAAPTISLSAEPTTIEKGQSSTLSWTSANATSVDIEPTVGTAQAQGSSTVTPQESTTYTATATGAGGTATSEARVTVTVPPPPPPPPAPPKVSESELFSQNVKDAFFDFDKSNIRPDAATALQGDADFLKQHPDISFTIEGHCDERGSEQYNLGLGDRRAASAKAYLVNLGVPADRITTISYGKDRPFCTEHTEACWQRNRRAHLVYGTESSQ